MEVTLMQKANITWNSKQINKMVGNGSLRFDNVIQRGYAWDVKRKSLFIHSLLGNYPVPPFYVVKTDETFKSGNKTVSVYDCLDGKQRSSAICGFINGDYALKGDDLEVEYEGDLFNLDGSYFEDLPEDMQDEIMSYSFTFYFFTDITDEEVNEMFRRLNNGKPLTNIELSRVKAADLDTIREIANHTLFTETLTEANRNKYVNEDIVIKSHIILTESEPCLDTKAVRPILENLVLNEDEIDRLNKVFDRVYKVHSLILADETDKTLNKKIAKKLVTRSHLISLVPIIDRSISEGVSTENMVEFVQIFFDGSPTMNELYNANCHDGANHTARVMARLEAVAEEYEDWKADNKIKTA